MYSSVQFKISIFYTILLTHCKHRNAKDQSKLFLAFCNVKQGWTPQIYICVFIYVLVYLCFCICICVFLSVLFVQSLLYCGKTLAWDSRQTSLDTPRQVEQFPNFPLKYLKYLKYFAKTFRYLQQVEQFTNLPFINVFEILEMYLANKFGHLR